MRPDLVVTVRGIPRPQGSMKIVPVGRGRSALAHSDTLVLWRNTVVERVCDALPLGWTPITETAFTRLVFTFPRPERHYRRNGDLRDDAPTYTAQGSDLDKLVRAIFDALTIAGVVDDDRRIAALEAEKRYGAPGDTGVRIEVSRFDARQKPHKPI